MNFLGGLQNFEPSLADFEAPTIHDPAMNFSQALIYRVGHIKCYRAIALQLLIISKIVPVKSFSVREGCHTGPPYFLVVGGAEAMSRSTPLF